MKKLALAAIIGLISSNLAFAQTGPANGFYQIVGDFIGAGGAISNCPNGASLVPFNNLVLTSTQLTGYFTAPPTFQNGPDLGPDFGVVGVVQMPITSMTGNVISGTDSWRFTFAPGSGSLATEFIPVSGPYQFTITPVDENAFMLSGTYTVPSTFAAPPVHEPCIEQVKVLATRTGPEPPTITPTPPPHKK